MRVSSDSDRQQALEFIRAGDVLVVWKLGRLGRPPAIIGEKLDAIIATLDGGMSKAVVCRNIGVKRTTLIETVAQVGWPGATGMPQR